MKKNILKMFCLFLVSASMLMTGCNDYLSIIPKGKKTPTTIDDYRRLLENVMMKTHGDMYEKSKLVNEGLTTSYSNPPTRNNYLWIEEEGARIDATHSDYGYDVIYKALFFFNLVINDVPKIETSGDAEKKEAEELVAQAKVFRALFMFHAVNTYAKVYDPATAATDGGIPYLSVADDLETLAQQKTVAEIYGNIMTDLNDAIHVLGEDVLNFMFPTKTAAIGLRARIHLFMRNFDEALTDAETVLATHNFIYDMVRYHRDNIDPDLTGNNIQGASANFGSLPKVGFTDAVAENLWVVGGQLDVTASRYLSFQIPFEDTPDNEWCTRGPGRFEEGDTRFLCNFWNRGAYGEWRFWRSDYGNTGGIRTLEMYLIRAECNARKGTQTDIDKAMDDLDAIRSKRITYVYQP